MTKHPKLNTGQKHSADHLADSPNEDLSEDAAPLEISYSKSKTNELLLRQSHPIRKRQPKQSKMKQEFTSLLKDNIEELKLLGERQVQSVVLNRPKEKKHSQSKKAVAVCPRVFNQESIDRVRKFKQECRQKTDCFRKRLFI